MSYTELYRLRSYTDFYRITCDVQIHTGRNMLYNVVLNIHVKSFIVYVCCTELYSLRVLYRVVQCTNIVLYRTTYVVQSCTGLRILYKVVQNMYVVQSCIDYIYFTELYRLRMLYRFYRLCELYRLPLRKRTGFVVISYLEATIDPESTNTALLEVNSC